jgi:hypothetical protein
LENTGKKNGRITEDQKDMTWSNEEGGWKAE